MTRHRREFSVGTNRLSMVAAALAFGGLLAAGTDCWRNRGPRRSRRSPAAESPFRSVRLAEAAAARRPQGLTTRGCGASTTTGSRRLPRIRSLPICTRSRRAIRGRPPARDAVPGADLPQLQQRRRDLRSDRFLVVSKNKQNDPQIQVATNGVIYVAWLDNFTRGSASSNRAIMARPGRPRSPSPEKGTKPSWSDKPWLAISRTGRRLHRLQRQRQLRGLLARRRQYFSAPVKTNNDTRYWFANGGAVAANGTVYFSEADFSQDYTGPAHVNILKSTNGGSPSPPRSSTPRSR